MIKSESNNTFNDGLMMDLNPLMTPNNVMTNCLNGTLVTFNGNEYMLQNDMGNGRVETAYLPEGYIPMGTCELGGIIYIVSYNPLQGTCQVGSFPSPERNITSDERDTTSVTLTNDDFQWEGSQNGAGVYYLKKDLDSTLQFYPGDKFVVYSSNVSVNSEKLNRLSKDKTRETLRLSLGTVTSDGKLVIFNSETLKQFNDGEGEYHIKEHNTGNNFEKVDLDGYRSLVTQPYNIFNSKISGTLVLVAELVQFNSFSVGVKHHFEENEDSKKYNPIATLGMSGDYEYVPYGIQKKFFLLDENGNEVAHSESDFKLSEEARTEHEITMNLFSNEETILDKVIADDPKYFDSPERKVYTLNYELTPCMIWGPIKHLTVKGSIALNMVGSGYIGMSAWKYYNSDTKCNLTWGLEVYEKEGQEVDRVEMEFTRLTSETTSETISYKINKKNSYHGTFYELIPLDYNYYKFRDSQGNEGQLQSNTLYLVKTSVYYVDEVDPKEFYRWLYTNTVFNGHFYETLDYKILPLDMFKTKLDLSYDIRTETESNQYTGLIKAEKTEDFSAFENKRSLSAIKTYRKNIATCTAKILLENTFDTFRLHTNKNSLQLSLEKDQNPLIVESKIKYTDKEDADMNIILSNEVLKTFSNESLPNNATVLESHEDDFIGNSENPPKYGNSFKVETSDISPNYDDSSDSFTFNLEYDLVTIAKAYSKMDSKKCSSKGKVQPLAYDNETFSEYNLEYNNGKWYPKLLGCFGFRERESQKGRAYVGYLNESGLTNFQFAEANDIDFNWTGDPNIIECEKKSNWNNTLVFVSHHASKIKGSGQVWNDRAKAKPSRKNGFDTASWNLSTDSRSDPTENVVFVLMKSNVDDYYYPLNCARKSRTGSTDDVGAYNAYIGENWKEFYNHVATVLNNLYRFVDEVTIKSYFLPNYIYYGDDYTYTTSILLTASLNEGDKGTVQLVIDNLYFVDINEEIIEKFTSGLTPEQIEDLTPNVSTTVTDTIKRTQTITNTIKDTTSGVTLRNLYLDQQVEDLGIIICGYDGKDSGKTIPSTSLNKRSIYWVNNGEVETATKFKPIILNYSGGKNSELTVTAPSSPTYLYETNGNVMNISKDYILNDNGLIIAKDPPKSELTVIRYGYDDKGSVYGYLKRGLSPDYEFWQ